MVKQKIIGKAFESGKNEFVSYASGLGKTGKEGAEFADAVAKLFTFIVTARATVSIARGRAKNEPVQHQKLQGKSPKLPGKPRARARG
jgi:hypothetical protein